MLKFTHIKGMPVSLSGPEVSNDPLELKVIYFSAFLKPLVKNWDDTERRVPKRTDS